ncbi:glycosyltransferase family 4 protein [Halobium salinum]|uniref:Glycosyltransferase family 4 protein n=1 Tax=Halobium salinum TaxID=1364940 RepID=A0ABD5PAM4_9EURY|nr:glycosyltransferase family 4 protein [Halobium salinum]
MTDDADSGADASATDGSGADADGDRLDVGFVPAEVPGAGLTGAVETSALLVEHLSRRHDLTVYVASQHAADDVDLPAEDRVEYVIHDDLPKLPHPITAKHRALREETDALESHDLVHSYSSVFVPVLADLSTPTISTLNSYVAVCPKGDMRYHGKRTCSGPGPAKCVACVGVTGARRRQGLENEARSAYSSLGKLPLVRDSMARRNGVDAYHALSPHLAEDYAALDFPAERTRVIPHFYDGGFRRDPRTTAGDPVTLLYVGGLREFKGVQVLVRGLAELRSRGVDARLRVAGAGPYGDRIKRLVGELGLADAVAWHGYVDHDDLPDLYAGADAFVYPGLIDEPFGRVLLEALAAGTPVVASDVGSTDYIVGDAGERFESGDERALADAVERLVADYEERAGAIPDQLARFEPETVLAQFDELYRDVATGRLRRESRPSSASSPTPSR